MINFSIKTSKKEKTINTLMNLRPLSKIVTEYNTICKADEVVIDEMLLYRKQDIPKTLLKTHNALTKKIKALDEERYLAIMRDHNFYRHHYAQMYPHLLNKSIIKQTHA